MRNRAPRWLRVLWAWVLGSCGTTWAQDAPPQAPPASAQAPAAAGAQPSLWGGVREFIDRSVDEIGQREMWIDSAHWRVAISPYTHHFRYNAEHRTVYAVAVERQRADDWLAGVSLFRNSFGQPSSYAYVGLRFPELLGEPQLYGQVSGGLLYGYRGAYQSKVPLNFRGFAPGALVSVGWRSQGGLSSTVHLLGDAGVMLQFSLDLPY